MAGCDLSIVPALNYCHGFEAGDCNFVPWEFLLRKLIFERARVRVRANSKAWVKVPGQWRAVT